MKKRKVLFILCIVFVLVGQSVFAAGAKEEGSDKPTFVMVPKLVHPFYEPCIQGFKDAGEKYGVRIEIESPPKLDIALQVKVIEDLIARGVDGIAISAVDNKGLVSVIDEAIAAGITVICFDADAPSSNRATYIGTNNFEAGVTAGEYMIDIMNDTGDVGILQGGMAPNLNERQEGFRKAAEHSGVNIIAFETYQADFAEGVNKTEAMLETYPSIKGIFGPEAYGAPVVATVLKEQGRAGQIVVGGFDDLAETITAIKDGSVQFCLVQKAYKMGWVSVEILKDLMAGKEVANTIDTGVIIVNKDNVDSYMAQVKAEIQK